jgi:hypothetical protein
VRIVAAYRRPGWSRKRFIARDSGGAYFNYEEEPARRSAAKLLAKDEARAKV